MTLVSIHRCCQKMNSFLEKMITSIFTSKYKVMAFTVFGLSIILFISLIFLVSPTILEPEFWNSMDSMGMLLASISILIFGSLPILKMKIIRIEKHQLVFQKYVFGSNIRMVNLKYYDHYKTVLEETENGLFESVWLIKDGKLEDSFSTYQYVNFTELKSAIVLENKGELDASPMKQLLCRFGSTI